jgi:rubrerythrin
VLRPIINWSDLLKALKRLKADIFVCEECGHVWIGGIEQSPVRCPKRDCRALANSPKYSERGTATT